MTYNNAKQTRFRQDVQDALLKKEKRGAIFYAGKPHPIFLQKGMPNQPIMVSPAVIRKARKSKYNDHLVEKSDLEHLPELLNNPIALCKSLTVHNSFIAVLDTKDDHNWPVIVSIKPENGYNQITSIYGRENFEQFIKRTNEAGAVLSVNKNKATEGIWASIQSRGETTFDDFDSLAYSNSKNLSTPQQTANQPARGLNNRANGAQNAPSHKENIMEWKQATQNTYHFNEELECELGGKKVIFGFSEFGMNDKQCFVGVYGENEHSYNPYIVDMGAKETKSLIDGLIKNYENNPNVSINDIDKALSEHDHKLTPEEMEQSASDEPEWDNEEYIKEKKQEFFEHSLNQRKTVSNALKNGSLSCLPGKDGYADTSPAMNIANGTRYHGANLLCLKENQKQNGFPTAEYVSIKDMMSFMKETGLGLAPKHKDTEAKIMFSKGEYYDSTELFNVSACAKPEELRKWAATQLQERTQEKQEYMKNKLGDAYKPYERKENQPGPEVPAKSAEPEKYLGAYLAAVSMGGKFKPSPEQAAEFSKNFEASLFQKGQNGHTDPFKLSKICNAASEHCKEVIKEVRQGQRREQAQTQTQTQSRGGRGM